MFPPRVMSHTLTTILGDISSEGTNILGQELGPGSWTGLIVHGNNSSDNNTATLGRNGKRSNRILINNEIFY